MNNPVVLITGGLTGIGRAAAVAFAKKGAQVVVAGRRDEAGKALANELRSFGSEAEFINADVRKEDDVRALVDKTVARFGRLEVAVNNAGSEGQVVPITDQTAESYAATFDTNVLGVILSMKHEVRVMQGQGSGSIINISSTYGHEGAAGASVYVGSKHAVEGITKSVALEIAKSGIRVNGVAPGPTDTGMLTRFTSTPENKAALVTGVPMGRLGLSEEIANAIVFIASDEASFITGHVSTSTAVIPLTDPVRARRFAPRPVKGGLPETPFSRHRFQFRRIQIMADKPMKIPGPDHPISIDANPSRVVVAVGGKVIADTRDALTLREASYPAVQYISRRDVDMAALTRSEHTTYCPYKGDASYYNIPTGGDRSLNAVWTYETPFEAMVQIKDYVAFYPDRVDEIS